MTGALRGKVALITGGGTGIGRGIANAFVEAGARVAVCGRREEPLRATAAALGGPEHAMALCADVTRAADRERVLRDTVDTFGTLDILVNNAGIVRGVGPLTDLDEPEWQELLATNATAPLFLATAALPWLRPQRGVILNISTGASLKPVPGYAAYGASKAALNHLTRALALEAAPDVRVNLICPGGVDTPIFGTFLSPDGVANAHRGYEQHTPLGHMGRPLDIARAAVFLASDDAGWITGATLAVDGGLNLA